MMGVEPVVAEMVAVVVEVVVEPVDLEIVVIVVEISFEF